MIGEFRQAIGIAMFALAAIGSPGDVAAQGQRVELTLLHVNDVYEISPKEGKGGLAELMTLLRAERARSPNTITTFGGDLLSPSVMSGLFKGEQMIDVINAVGIDVAVPGNHEFDFGPDVFAKRVAESKFTWLGTNVLGADGQPFAGMAASEIREVGGFKIGLFGVLTGETTHLSSPGDPVTFTDVEAAANQAVVIPRRAGRGPHHRPHSPRYRARPGVGAQGGGHRCDIGRARSRSDRVLRRR